MKKIDLPAIQKIIAGVAAGEIMPRFRNLVAGDVVMKGVNDPVTIADKAAEQALIARLTDYLPGSVVVGEESFAHDPAIVAHFGGEPDVWVIDPIDGTRNFIAGNPEFAVMVALVRRRRTVAAWIHDPNSGDTLMAEQGGGVWLGGHRMNLSGHDRAAPPLGIVGSRLKKMLARPEVTPVLQALPQLTAGSAAAFDYGRLFTGPTVFAGSDAPRAAYLLYRQSKPWDHMPGLFLMAEAGGYAADFAGKPYDMESTQSGLLIAPDRERWQWFYDILRPAIDTLVVH